MKLSGIVISILVLLTLSTTVYGLADETLVLALSFDDAQGDKAKDSSLSRLDGKIVGAKWVDGKFGKALEFNGTSDYVRVDDSPKLLLLQGGTFMAWIYIKEESGHASWPRILIKSNTNGGTNGYDFLLDRALGYSIRLCIGGVCASYVPVETKNWHHIAATYDGKKIYIYLDGKRVGEGDQAAPAQDTTGSPLNIGNGIAIDRAYHGILDEIRIWSRALNADDIQTQMASRTYAVEPSEKTAITWGNIKRITP